MAIDNKYGRVTTEHGDIGENEPVIIFRARDKFLLELLDEYYTLCEEESPSFHLQMIEEAYGQIADWQATYKNEVRTPTSKEHQARLEK